MEDQLLQTPYYDDAKHHQNFRRRAWIVSSICALAVLCFAVFALVPSTAWFGRKVIDEPYDDGGFFYTGTLYAGKFSGQGKITFADGGSFEGGFDEGRFHGEGKFQSADGWAFGGIFEKGRPTEGVLHTKDGNLTVSADHYALAEKWDYIGGASLRGQRGLGKFTFSDGAVYEGEFADGMAQGQGSYTDREAHVLYRGQWKDGLYDGEGEYTAPDSSFIYKGNFRAGKFDGAGTVTEKGGKKITGTWKNGWRVEDQ